MIGSDGLSETSVITRYLKKIVFLKSSSLSIAPGDGTGIRANRSCPLPTGAGS